MEKGVKMLLKSSQVQVFLQKEKGNAAKSVESNSRIRQKWQKNFGYFFLIFFAFFNYDHYLFTDKIDKFYTQNMKTYYHQYK